MNEQFERFDVIGSGRYTVVYEGHDHGPLDRAVAIKQLAKRWHDDQRRQAAFMAEAKFLGNLEHEHLLKVYDVDQTSHLVITELLEGSLDRLISKEGPLPSNRVRSVLQQSLRALNHLHKKNVLYGAVRPSKLLFSDRGKLKLSSFERIENGIVPKPEVEKYVAPETLSTDFGNIGPTLDLYSLGFTALELLLADKFDSIFPVISSDDGISNVGWLRWHSSEQDLPPVKQLVPGVDDDVATALDAMLKKQVPQRPQSAIDAFAMLKDIDPIPIIDGVERSVMRGVGLGAAVAPQPKQPTIDGEPGSAATKQTDRAAVAASLASNQRKSQSANKAAAAPGAGKRKAAKKKQPSQQASRKKPSAIRALVKTMLLLLLTGAAGFGGWWLWQNDPYGWFKVAETPVLVEPVETVELAKKVVKDPVEPPPPALSMDEIFEAGKTALAANKFGPAIDNFTTVLDHDHGKYLLAFLLRAQSFHGRNSDEEDHHHAEEDLTAFLSEADSTATDNQKADAHLLRGRIYRDEEELDPAVNDYRSSVSLRPDAAVQKELAQLLLARANMALEAKRIDPAVADLEDARLLDPSLVGIDTKLARVRFERGQQKLIARNFGAAKNDFDRAVELVDDEPKYYVARGECNGSFGEIDKGIADYSTAIKISSAPEADWFVGRAKLYRNNRRPTEALADLNRAIEIAADQPASYALRGRLYREDLQQFDNAVGDFRSALKHGFRPPFEINLAIGDTFYDAGEALGRKGRFVPAIKQFGESQKQYLIMNQDPKLTADQQTKLTKQIQAACRRKGDCFSSTKDYPQAIEQYTDAIKASGDQDYEAYTRRANCHKSQQNFAEALSDLQQALKINDAYNVARYRLGQTYIKRGGELARRRLSAVTAEKAKLKQQAVQDYQQAMAELERLISVDAQTRYFDLIIAAATKLNTIDTSPANAAVVKQWKDRKQQHLAGQ